MHSVVQRWVFAFISLLGLLTAHAQTDQGKAPDRSVLLIVLDGLRPDYVTPEIMPNLYALGERGVVGEKHHSVFPTVTRINASSFSTGAYPKTHGVMGNTIYYPGLMDGPKSTGDAANLIAVNEKTNNQLQTAPTLAERVQAAGGKLLVVSAGSSGSSYCLNSRVSGGAIINTELVLPADLQPVVDEVLGPPAEEAFPNIALNRRAVDAYLKIGLDRILPTVTIMWLSDPDHTTHSKGIGSEDNLASLRGVDEEIGRIVKAHEERGMTGSVDVVVSSDHGFSTHTGRMLGDFLNAEELKATLEHHPITAAAGALYMEDPTDEAIATVVRYLQSLPWVGGVYTQAAEPGSLMGAVPGTLSLDAVFFNHERAPHILMDSTWTDDENANGWKGTTTQTGVAGHGTASPWDIHNTLVAWGPSFKTGVRSPVPSGNVDIAPTICRVLGIPVGDDMDGRVLEELLKGGPDPASIEVRTNKVSTSTELAHETYQLELYQSEVNGHTYVDYTKTTRSRK